MIPNLSVGHLVSGDVEHQDGEGVDSLDLSIVTNAVRLSKLEDVVPVEPRLGGVGIDAVDVPLLATDSINEACPCEGVRCVPLVVVEKRGDVAVVCAVDSDDTLAISIVKREICGDRAISVFNPDTSVILRARSRLATRLGGFVVSGLCIATRLGVGAGLVDVSAADVGAFGNARGKSLETLVARVFDAPIGGKLLALARLLGGVCCGLDDVQNRSCVGTAEVLDNIAVAEIDRGGAGVRGASRKDDHEHQQRRQERLLGLDDVLHGHITSFL